jgi:uncharacterized membrane protein
MTGRSAALAPLRIFPMKSWSLIGLLFAAAIFATIPISPQVTPRGLALLWQIFCDHGIPKSLFL